MLVIPSSGSKDTCDGYTRRDWLRVGGSGVLGLSLAGLLQGDKARADENSRYGGPGFGKAKSVILLYLQGGAEPHRPVGPERECPRRCEERLRQHQHQDSRNSVH